MRVTSGVTISRIIRRNSMIEQLHEQDICDSDGNLYAMSAPSNFEIMKKINELVEEVNRLKEKFGEE